VRILYAHTWFSRARTARVRDEKHGWVKYDQPTREVCGNIRGEVNHSPPRDIRQPRQSLGLVWTITLPSAGTAKQVVPRLERDHVLEAVRQRWRMRELKRHGVRAQTFVCALLYVL
jgi:hypothetical protein